MKLSELVDQMLAMEEEHGGDTDVVFLVSDTNELRLECMMLGVGEDRLEIHLK